MFRRILVSIDLSDPPLAREAIARAVAMADDDGEVRLVHVRPLMPLMMLEYVPDGFDSERQVDAEKKLGELARSVQLPTERVSMVVRQGGVYPEVIAEAESWDAKVIVTGAHRPAMSTYLLGSNASAIVRHARCSVFVVRT
ncbi:MAG: universal stress protein [Beijerinckiaceae bacterium]